MNVEQSDKTLYLSVSFSGKGLQFHRKQHCIGFRERGDVARKFKYVPRDGIARCMVFVCCLSLSGPSICGVSSHIAVDWLAGLLSVTFLFPLLCFAFVDDRIDEHGMGEREERGEKNGMSSRERGPDVSN